MTTQNDLDPVERQKFLDSHFFGDISYGDMFQILDDVKDCLVRHGGFTGCSADAVRDAYRNAINVGDFGRAVSIYLHDTRAFRVEMVSALQTEVLRKWIGWKIRIELTCRDGGVLILAVDEVSMKEEAAITNLGEFLAKLAREEQAARDKHYGPRNRQLREITERLPDHLGRVTDERPFSVIAIFDNYRGKRKNLAIYLLSNSELSEICIHTPDAGRMDAVYGGGPLTVDYSGTIHQHSTRFINGIEAPIEGKLWIDKWLIPSDYAGNKLVVTRDADGKHWEIDFSPRSVIRDENP